LKKALQKTLHKGLAEDYKAKGIAKAAFCLFDIVVFLKFLWFFPFKERTRKHLHLPVKPKFEYNFLQTLPLKAIFAVLNDGSTEKYNYFYVELSFRQLWTFGKKVI